MNERRMELSRKLRKRGRERERENKKKGSVNEKIIQRNLVKKYKK